MSAAEKALAEALAADPLEGWDLVRQFKFHATRQWKFDFAFPSQKLAVEVEGRAHCTYAGHRQDCEKSNEATRQGWRILRFPARESRRASQWVELIREVLCFPEGLGCEAECSGPESGGPGPPSSR